jgi:hypothetical protein
MKKLPLYLATALLLPMGMLAQSITRSAGETTEQLVNRLMPRGAELAHPVLETNTWDSTSKTIIAFYGVNTPKDGYNEYSITGHLYVPTGANTYRDISFGPILPDGGDPEIISVFFANSDKDKAKELVVLCQYPQRHYDYSGDFYETYIYDNPGNGNQLVFFEKLSNQFFGCECGYRDGRADTSAKYKTAKDIKARLKALGF